MLPEHNYLVENCIVEVAVTIPIVTSTQALFKDGPHVAQNSIYTG